MSDDLKETLGKTKETAEFKPFLEGLEKVAEHSVNVEKRLKEGLEAIDTKIDRKTEDLENKVNTSIEDLVENVKRMREASMTYRNAAGLVMPGDGSAALNEVIGKDFKAHAGGYEIAAGRLADGLSLKDSHLYMASSEWFYHASRAQHRKYAGRAAEHAERADKIAQAMNDLYDKGGNVVTKAPMQEDIDSEGGYLIPTPVEADIARLMTDAGKIYPLCRQMSMTSKQHKIPSENTAVTVGWLAEEGELTGTNPTFSQVTIEAEKLYGRATMSLELLQDSAPGLLSWLLTVFSEKMAGELDKQVILGDGTTTELLGVMNGVGVNAVTDSTRTSITWQHIVDGYTAASEGSARDGGVWICSPWGFAQLIGLTDSQGMPIVHFGTATQGAAAATLLGKPIIESARLGGSATLDNTTAATKKTSIVFGPPSAFTFGTRLGMTWDVTDQVNWTTYQADARLVGRFGGRPTVPAAFSYTTVKVP